MASLLRLARAARQGARAVLGSGREGAWGVLGSGRIAHGAAEGRGAAAAFSSFSDPDAPTGSFGPRGRDKLPTFVDWMKYGAVTPVQDQGDCGSCWAFGATALVECANYLTTKKLLKLSEQHLIDANNIRNDGCKGGSALIALGYIIENGGLLLEKDYPYTGVQGSVKPITAFGVTIDDHHSRYTGSETYLKWAVSVNPVLASVGADARFLSYTGEGVIDGPNHTLDEMDALGISHSVIVIGYGENLSGEKYWLVKNSHGGELMLLARENGLVGGAFGITRRITQISKSSKNGLVTVRTDEELGYNRTT